MSLAPSPARNSSPLASAPSRPVQSPTRCRLRQRRQVCVGRRGHHPLLDHARSSHAGAAAASMDKDRRGRQSCSSTLSSPSRRRCLGAGWATTRCPALLTFVRTGSGSASALATVRRDKLGLGPALRLGAGAQACDSYGEAPALPVPGLRFSDGGATGVASPAGLVVRVGGQGRGWGGLSCWGLARWLARW